MIKLTLFTFLDQLMIRIDIQMKGSYMRSELLSFDIISSEEG